MDPWSSPTIVPSHPADKLSDLWRDAGTADSFGSGDQPPEQLEALRCQLTTVSGLTTMRALAQLRQARRRNTQNIRSVGPSLGRGRFCLKTANCWRRAKFSTINSSRDRNNTRAQPNVRVRARRIILRALTADDRWASQTPSLIALNAHKISHDGIMSKDRSHIVYCSTRSVLRLD